MKKLVTLTAVILMVTFMTAGWSMAGKGAGPGDGTGPIHDVLAGVPFQFTGDVIAVVPGDGIEIATASGNVKIYGIGPYRYWSRLGVDRPAVGDSVDVSGYTVNYNGVDRNIAVSLTISGKTVQLRDPVTGAPLWTAAPKRK